MGASKASVLYIYIDYTNKFFMVSLSIVVKVTKHEDQSHILNLLLLLLLFQIKIVSYI